MLFNEKRVDLIPSKKEYDLMRDHIKFLEYFKKATTEFQSKKKLTLYLVPYYFSKIEKALEPPYAMEWNHQ